MIRARNVAINCSCEMAVLVRAGQDDDTVLAAHLKAIHGMPNAWRYVLAFRFEHERASDGRRWAIT